MVLRWTTLVLGLFVAGVVADVCVAEPVVITAERTMEVELASTSARSSRFARGIEAPRHGPRGLAHEHPPAVPTSFVLAPPRVRVAIVSQIAPVRSVQAAAAPADVARGPPAA